MMKKNPWLLVAGLLTLAAALMHVAIIIGGADWYRFFGAGEELARLAEAGSAYPAQVTGVIALVLASWSLYAFSGAGLLPRFPFSRIALVLIAIVFLLRGLLGIPAVLMFEHPYFQELGHSMKFMVISSAICLVYGVCFAVGTLQVWGSLKKKGVSDIPVY